MNRSRPGQRTARRVLAIAHRGGAGVPANRGIENSIEAFAHAVSLGYNHLETDVWCTLDGVPYAVHDRQLGRLTGQDVRIDQLTSAQVDRLRLDGRAALPRLESLLMQFPHAWFSIDVKSDAAIEPTCAVIERLAAQRRVCLCSFDHRRMRRIRRRAPQVMTAASRREVALAMLLPRALLASLPRRYAMLSVPLASHGIAVADRRFIDRAHAVGALVCVWTIDDPEEMEVALALGADGIFTDRTDVLRDVLRAQKQWEQA